MVKRIPTYLKKKIVVKYDDQQFRRETIEGVRLTFMGAAGGTVTGSKYLLETENRKIMIDCGLFQGFKELRLRNRAPLPIPPDKIDAVILTHAHIDHSGYIPLLVKNGFKGKIYCTHPTRSLCEVLLPDSGYLNEEDAKHANKYGYSKHKKALPLYTQRDAFVSLKKLMAVDFGEEIDVFGEFKVTIERVGHILGAGSVFVEHEGKSILFSGDVGRQNDPVIGKPDKIKQADYITVESTYGDRLHDPREPDDQLEEIINSTVSKGGKIIVPAFAVGRSQLILYYVNKLKQENRIPDIPVFLDSPMSIEMVKILKRYTGEHHISEEICDAIHKKTVFTTTAKESKKIVGYNYPLIIISASGMATGGRILHHLKNYMPDHKNTIVFAGFQAGGTRGNRIVSGEKEIKIHGHLIPVKSRIEVLHNVSAHGDYEELLTWLSGLERPPKKIFITHGEDEAAEAFKEKVERRFGWKCMIAKYLQKEQL